MRIRDVADLLMPDDDQWGAGGEFAFAISARYDRAEPDVGFRGGWTYDARLIGWTLGDLDLDADQVVRAIGPVQVARAERAAEEHCHNTEFGNVGLAEYAE